MAGRRQLNRQGEAQETRARIIRKASRYVYIFGFAGVVAAVGGAAFVAWLLSVSGLPFLRTWLAVTLIVVMAVLALVLWNRWKERNGGR